MQLVFLVNGVILVGLGALMWLVALSFAATRSMFFEAGSLLITLGTLVSLASASGVRPFRRLHGFVLTASVWVTAAAAGALPLWMWGLSATDAFFEAMSGITTTGATILAGLDRTAPGILLWRAILQGVGGIGFVVVAIALLPVLRVGGMQLFRTESSERGDKEAPTAAAFAAQTVWIYLGLILLCGIAYRIGGMTAFEATVHALTTLSTGGYSTSDASFGHFDSAALQWSGTVFMLAGGLPLAWYLRALQGKDWRSEQVRIFLLSLGGIILALALWRVLASDETPEAALRLVAFNVVSVATTTGFASVDYTTWGALAAGIFLFITAMGGCTGSTAGGAKMMRWMVFFRSLFAALRKVHSPHGVFPMRFEGRVIDPAVTDGVIAYFFFFTLTVLSLAVGLALCDLDFLTSLSGALTAVANVGPGIGPVIGPAGNFSTLPDIAKWLLSFGMYAGRLEMMTVFVLLLPAFWREIA